MRGMEIEISSNKYNQIKDCLKKYLVKKLEEENFK